MVLVRSQCLSHVFLLILASIEESECLVEAHRRESYQSLLGSISARINDYSVCTRNGFGIHNSSVP